MAVHDTINYYRLGKAAKGFTTLLNPQKHIIEGVLAMLHHQVKVVEILGSDQVGQSGDDDQGVYVFRVRELILKEDHICGPGDGCGLDSRIVLSLLK